MTDIYSSLILDSQDNLNVTERRGSEAGKHGSSRKSPMDFGDEGMDFIDSILSREEADDVITMMIDAKESQGCLQLPSFCTSSQVGGGESQRHPLATSLSPPLSPILAAGDTSGSGRNNTMTRLRMDNELNTEITEGVQVRNRKNVNSSSIGLGKYDEIGELETQATHTLCPGTLAGPINRSDGVVTGCHDPVNAQGSGSKAVAKFVAGGESVATHVAMGNNVTTSSVMIADGTDGTEIEGDGKDCDIARADGSESTESDGEGEDTDEPVGDGIAQNEVGSEDRDGSDGSEKQPDSETDITNKNSSRLDVISDKMDLVEEILAMMGEKSTNLGSTVKSLEASLEFSQHEIETLKKENEDLKEKLGAIELEDKRTQFQTNLLEDKIDRLETASKKRNLIFEGIPEIEGRREEVDKTIGVLFDQLDVHKGVNFEACYRMGPYVKGRSRPILVTFERQVDRDLLYARRMDLKHTTGFQRVWVNEDLGPISKKKRGVIRLIAREASLQGIDCRTGKYSIRIDNVKYDGGNLDELPPKLQLTQLKQVMVNETTLAYQSEYAPFSNFYTCNIKLGKHTFFCVEQAYHFVHAKTVNKHLIAMKIYLSRDVRYIKQLGHELGSTPEWEGRQFEVMYACIKRKFEQNQDLRELLLKSGDLELVEATPDSLWGCGATLSSNVIRRKEWRGRNKQGEILMVVREELKQRKLRQENPPKK